MWQTLKDSQVTCQSEVCLKDNLDECGHMHMIFAPVGEVFIYLICCIVGS